MKKLFLAMLLIAGVCLAQTPNRATFIDEFVTVPFSATPVFNAFKGNVFKITLTGNVTSSTLSNARAGQELYFEICQDGTGGRTFVPPTSIVGWVTIPSAANACIMEAFVYDGTSALPDQDVAGLLKGPEAAAPAGVANFDLLYADSTAHRWKMINNNGTAAQVVASGADINTSDQVTVTHLASPLPTAQGGTAQNSTATFPTSGVVVTEAGTETLTNKTLTSPIDTSPTINTGVSQGSGLKHQRFGTTCTTTASVGALCSTTYTWTSAFADANYTVLCTGFSPQAGQPVLAIPIRTASQITVQIESVTAAAVSYAEVDCIAAHD
jgi:hypothetical protein